MFKLRHFSGISACQPGGLLEAEPVIETATAATAATAAAAAKAEKIYGFELKVNKMCDKAHQVRQ